MKNVYINENESDIFTHSNGVYCRIAAKVMDETGLEDNYTKNILLTDNINMPWSELEVLRSDKIEEYRLQLEAE